jgi:ribosomal protein S14
MDRVPAVWQRQVSASVRSGTRCEHCGAVLNGFGWWLAASSVCRAGFNSAGSSGSFE